MRARERTELGRALQIVAAIPTVALFGLRPWHWGMAIPILLLGIVLFAAGMVVGAPDSRRRAYVQKVRNSDSDLRPPVLYLRSFSEVDQKIPGAADWVGRAFSGLGPVAAIGDAPPAANIRSVRAQDSEWQLTFADQLEKARLIVVIKGESMGLAWECDILKEHCDPGKVVVLAFLESPWTHASALFGARIADGFGAESVDPGEWPYRTLLSKLLVRLFSGGLYPAVFTYNTNWGRRITWGPNTLRDLRGGRSLNPVISALRRSLAQGVQSIPPSRPTSRNE